MLVLMLLQYHAAQEAIRETYAQSRLPDEEQLNSSMVVAQSDGEIAVRGVDPIWPKETGKERT